MVRSTTAGHVERMGDENWQRDQMPRKWMGNGGEEDRNCGGGCIKSGIDIMGEDWRKRATDKRNWGQEIIANSPITTVMPKENNNNCKLT